jgi:hypothetical protein
MIELLNFIFQSFWHFLGFMILFAVPFRFVISLIRIISDWHNTRKHGWRPYPTLTDKVDKDDEL